MQKWLKRICLGSSHRLPTWVCVGHASPTQQVHVVLEGLGEPINVTHNHVVVELRPLVLAICFKGHGHFSTLKRAKLQLTLSEAQPTEYALGSVTLETRDVIKLPADELCLFNVTGSASLCLPKTRLHLHYLYERVKLRLDRDPRNVYKMRPKPLFSMWLLYALPRPVALVSYADGQRSNIFPMDLIGPTDSPYFLLSLGQTRPSLPFIKNSGKLAVSMIPLEQTAVALQLGKNHRIDTADWRTLPFDTVPSHTFGLPTPSGALTVRELEVVEAHDLTEHTILIATTRHIEQRASGLHMCHAQRTFQHYLMERGRELPVYVMPH